MKKVVLFIIIVVMMAISYCLPAFATTITFADTVTNFPGYEVDPRDEIGTPNLDSMTISWDGGYIESVIINMATPYRLLYDTLFLNTDGGNQDSWNYIVHSGGSSGATSTLGNVPGDGLWAVDGDYDYTFMINPGGRIGHPNGIDLNNLSYVNGMVGTQIGNQIFYDFSGLGLTIGDNFTIAYGPYCANDLEFVPYSSVPEPATMLLFGLGLTCWGIVYRRKHPWQERW